jgi:F0F1-type ATP synthase membrane subunit a
MTILKIDSKIKAENIVLFFSCKRQNKIKKKRQCTKELVFIFVSPLTKSISAILTNNNAISPVCTFAVIFFTIRNMNKLVIMTKGKTTEKNSVFDESASKRIPVEDTRTCHSGV